VRRLTAAAALARGPSVRASAGELEALLLRAAELAP